MRGKTHCAIGVLAGIQLSLLARIPVSVVNIATSALFSLLPDLDKSNSMASGLIFNKKVSEKVFKLLVYILNTLIFIILVNMNSDFFLCGLMSLLVVIFFEQRVNHYKVRKVLTSFTLIVVSFLLFNTDVDVSFIFPLLIFSIFPWLKHRNFSHSIVMILLVFAMMMPIEKIIKIEGIAFIATFSYALHIFCDMFTKKGVALFYPFSEKMYSIGKLKVGGKSGDLIESIIVMVLFMFAFLSVIEHIGYNFFLK